MFVKCWLLFSNNCQANNCFQLSIRTTVESNYCPDTKVHYMPLKKSLIRRCSEFFQVCFISKLRKTKATLFRYFFIFLQVSHIVGGKYQLQFANYTRTFKKPVDLRGLFSLHCLLYPDDDSVCPLKQ